MPDDREEELRELCREYFDLHETIKDIIADGASPIGNMQWRAMAAHKKILEILGVEHEDWHHSVAISLFNNADDFENAVVDRYLKNFQP